MKERFSARMLRIHCSEADRWENQPLHEVILSKCIELGIAGATVYRGIESFGSGASIHRARALGSSKNAPIMITVIDREEEVEKLIPYLDRLIGTGLVARSRVEAVRYFGKAAL